MLSFTHCSYSTHMLKITCPISHCRLREGEHSSFQWLISIQGHVSVQPHWLCTRTIICIWFPDGGGSGFKGDGVGEESILYTPSLNQHRTTRSIHLETVLGCCTTATPAVSIRAQCKPKAASRWRRDKHTHRECLSLATTHSTKLVSENFFLLTQIPGTNHPTPI